MPFPNCFQTHYLLYILLTFLGPILFTSFVLYISYSELEQVPPSLPRNSSYIHPFCVSLVCAKCYLTCIPYVSPGFYITTSMLLPLSH